MCTFVRSFDVSFSPVKVIIVGAGLAGCATALSLASRNPKVRLAVIDDAESNCFKVGATTIHHLAL